MFSNLNFWEVGALALLALFIFGPERLPKVINDGLRMLRNLRSMARNATDDLSRELGTEVRLEDLHPKTFIRKHLLSEEEERELRRPFDDIYRDVKQAGTDTTDFVSRQTRSATPGYGESPRYDDGPRYGDTPGYEQRPPTGQPPADGTDPRRYDADAT